MIRKTASTPADRITKGGAGIPEHEAVARMGQATRFDPSRAADEERARIIGLIQQRAEEAATTAREAAIDGRAYWMGRAQSLRALLTELEGEQ